MVDNAGFCRLLELLEAQYALPSQHYIPDRVLAILFIMHCRAIQLSSIYIRLIFINLNVPVVSTVQLFLSMKIQVLDGDSVLVDTSY